MGFLELLKLRNLNYLDLIYFSFDLDISSTTVREADESNTFLWLSNKIRQEVFISITYDTMQNLF